MLISSPQSERFLPPFAESAAWMARALDAVLRSWYFRIAGMPSPWTAEALAMCTDAELQAFFSEYGCADYYPDTPRARRVAMMAAQARLWRFLGTPDAVRELCRYVLKDAECDVEIQDCLAFDADGALVHPELLYIFDAAVVPGALAASDADQERIVNNILKFAPNRETLRNLYFDFEGTAAQRVRMCWAGDSADDTAEPAFCVPALGVPVGGTIDTDSQTVLYIPRVGGAMEIGAPVRNPKDFELQTDSVPLDFGGAVIPGAPVRDPKDFELSGSMPLDGGTVSEDTGIDIDCYWGDTVTIPAGYTVQSVKSSELFLSKSSAYQGMNYSAFWRTSAFSTSSNYDASYFGLGVAPCLEIFLVSDTTQETFRGYYLSWPSSKTPGGTLPVAYRGVKVNEDEYVFWIDAAYQNTTEPYEIESNTHAYFCRIRLYDANGDQELWAFDFPSAFWQYQNGAFTWLGDPSQGISTGVYYYSTHGKTLIRIRCVPA